MLRLTVILLTLFAAPHAVASEIVVVPAWTVHVVLPDGSPAEGVKIRQVWQHYAFETNSHEESVVTDANGKASFPERRLSINPLMYIFGPVRSFFQSGLHASYKASSWLIVIGSPELAGEAIYLPDSPLPSRVVLRRTES